MSRMTPTASPDRVALIGDLVDSRVARDRQRLHDALDDVLARVNAQVPARDPLLITVGDEFQGVYDSLGAALDASFRIRALLHPDGDVRFGLGRGTVRTLDERRGIHDGPAYWAAREAVTASEERAARAQTRTARTTFVSATDDAGQVAAVQAALDCLDFMVGSMSDTARAILGGTMTGSTQHDVAEQQGISASAVSQRMRRDGIGVALGAMTTLAALP